MTTNAICALLERRSFTATPINGEIRIRDTLSPIKMTLINNGPSHNIRKILRALFAAAMLKREEKSMRGQIEKLIKAWQDDLNALRESCDYCACHYIDYEKAMGAKDQLEECMDAVIELLNAKTRN